MTKKEWQRRMAYEALVILGMLALLLFVCRLWPILLLVILGIFAAAIRLLFLSSPKVQPIQPDQQEVATHYEPQQAVTNQDSAGAEDAQSFGDLQTQITRWVRQEYPEARWVWKYPDSKARFQRGEDMAILLNRAGGYREAVIHLQGKNGFSKSSTCARRRRNPSWKNLLPPKRSSPHWKKPRHSQSLPSRRTTASLPLNGWSPTWRS